jgi:hypothetical protein
MMDKKYIENFEKRLYEADTKDYNIDKMFKDELEEFAKQEIMCSAMDLKWAVAHLAD